MAQRACDLGGEATDCPARKQSATGVKTNRWFRRLVTQSPAAAIGQKEAQIDILFGTWMDVRPVTHRRHLKKYFRHHPIVVRWLEVIKCQNRIITDTWCRSRFRTAGSTHCCHLAHRGRSN